MQEAVPQSASLVQPEEPEHWPVAVLHLPLVTTLLVVVQVPDMQSGSVCWQTVPSCRQVDVPQSPLVLHPDVVEHFPVEASQVPPVMYWLVVMQVPDWHTGAVCWQMAPNWEQVGLPQSASVLHAEELRQVPLVASHLPLGTNLDVVEQAPNWHVGSVC